MSRWISHRLLLLGLVLAGLAVYAVPVAAASDTTFSGRATALQGSVLGIPVGPFADTGDVPLAGGALEACLIGYPNTGSNAKCDVSAPDVTSGALNVTVLHSITNSGTNGSGQSQSQSNSSVASFNLDPSKLGAGLVPSIAGDFLSSSANASCSAGVATVSGSSQVTHDTIGPFLVIGGQRVDVQETANYDVIANLPPSLAALFPAGTQIIVNRQDVHYADAHKASITVDALYVNIPTALGAVQLTVASSHADITCGNTPANNCDGAKVTGGGWFLYGGTADHFAAAAKNNSTWGHLMYMDKAMGLKVQGSPQIASVTPDPLDPKKGSAHFEGPAGSNMQLMSQSVGWFVVDEQDNGEPGSADTFSISLLNAKGGPPLYHENGVLSGGNVQVHRCK